MPKLLKIFKYVIYSNKIIEATFLKNNKEIFVVYNIDKDTYELYDKSILYISKKMRDKYRLNISNIFNEEEMKIIIDIIDGYLN